MITNNNIAETVALDLLKIKAVKISPDEPFTWASGIKAPIYTDNRKIVSYPRMRSLVAKQLAELIKEQFPNATVIAGVATAGIPHAALVANLLELPMIYVRPKPKDHGTSQQIEGELPENAEVVMIDDLISTGQSVLKAADVVKNAGGTVTGIVSIFDYELSISGENFEKYGTKFYSVTSYTSLIKAAEQHQLISKDQYLAIKDWHHTVK